MALVGEKSEVTLDTEKIKIRIYNVPMDGNCCFTSFLSSLLDKKLVVTPKYAPVSNDQEILRKNLVEFMNSSDLWKKHRLLILNGEKITANSFKKYSAGFLTTRWGDDFAIQMISEMMDVPILVFQLENNDQVLVQSNEYLPSEFTGETTLENSVLLLFIRSQSHFNWISIVKNSDDKEMNLPVSKNQNPESQCLLDFCTELNIDSGKMTLNNFMNFNRLIGPTLKDENPGLSDDNLRILMKILWKESIVSVPMDTESQNFNGEYSLQPWFLSPTGKLKLKQFQLEALNLLRKSWQSGESLILGDEQGLGKTVQTTVFLRSLLEEGDSTGPFLIVVPLSTLPNWEKELKLWAPDVSVVKYSGKPKERKEIRLKKFNSSTQIILTTEGWLRDESHHFSSFKFDVVVLDEAHSLKDLGGKFVSSFKTLKSKFNLLLSGTPVQNKIEDLFTLLNSLDQRSFNNLDLFKEKYGDLKNKNHVDGLRKILAQRMIRRTSDAVLELEPLKIVTVVLELTPIQMKMYTLIQNPESTKSRDFFTLNNGKQESLQNTSIQLRQLCNHPFLFQKIAESSKDEHGHFDSKSLVDYSCKFLFLKKILMKLKSNGHRVLIFSQWTETLKLLEELLENESHKYERFDGQTKGFQRQPIIENFNEEKSETFVLLLTTRAGGQGINLYSADTVIIFDSDWNPHFDLQAIKRSHRIGQTKPVLVLRLITDSAIEAKVEEVDQRKLQMADLLLSNADGSKLDLTGEVVTPKSDIDMDFILNTRITTNISKSVNYKMNSFPDFDPFVFLCPESGKRFKNKVDLQNHRKRFYPFHHDFEHLFEGWLTHPRDTGVWSNPGHIAIRDFDPAKDQRLFIHYGYNLIKKNKKGEIIDVVWQTGYTANVHDVKGEIKNRSMECESLKAALHKLNGYEVDWTTLCTLGYSDYLNGSTSIGQDIKFAHRSLSPISNFHKLIIDHNRVSNKLKDNLMDKMMKFNIPVWKVKQPFPHTHPPYPGGGNDYYDQVLKAREKVKKFAEDFPGVVFDLDLEIKHPPPPPTVNNSRKPRTKKCPNPTNNPRCKIDAEPGRLLCDACRWIEKRSNPIKKCPNPTKNPMCKLDALPGRSLCGSCLWIEQRSNPIKTCPNPTKNPMCKLDAEPGRSLCGSCRTIERSSNPIKKCSNPTKNPGCKLDALPGRSLCGPCRWIERSSKPTIKCRNPTKNPMCKLNAERGKSLCGPCAWIERSSNVKKCRNPTKNPMCKLDAEPGKSLCNPCRSIERSSNVKKCRNTTKNSEQKIRTGPPRAKKGKFTPISSSEDSEESEFEPCSDESE